MPEPKVADLDFDDDDIDETKIPANLLAAARAGRDAIRRAADAERRALIAEAGLRLDDFKDDKAKRMLADSLMKQEWDSADALRAEAIDLGLIAKPEPPPNPALTDATEQANQQQQLAAGATPGAQTPAVPTGDPNDRLLGQFHADVKNGTDRDEARQKYMAGLIKEASEGNKTVIYDHDMHLAKARELEASELAAIAAANG